jgi:hypothetical protein
LTTEGDAKDIQSFLDRLLQGHKNFTPSVLEKFFNTKIDINWNAENNKIFIANHLFEGSFVNGFHSRVLLINDCLITDFKFEDFIFFVWWLSLVFPKLTFRAYGDDCENSGFLNVYQSGIWLSYGLIAGDDYYEFDMNYGVGDLEVDADQIKNSLDKKFNDSLTVDPLAAKAVAFIRDSQFGRYVEDAVVKEVLDASQESISDALRLAAFVFILYTNFFYPAEKMMLENSKLSSLTHLPLSQPIYKFIDRLKSLI